MGDLTKFEAVGGNLALDFVNTVANRGIPEKRRDLLENLADLECWLSAFRLPATDLVERDLGEARAIRERLHELFVVAARDRGFDDTALEQISELLHKMSSGRRLCSRAGRIIWEWNPRSHPLFRSLYPILAAAAELLISDEHNNVRECQGPGCGWLFVDRSRGRPRRWCAMRDCGNKAKARRHRRRQLTR